MRNFFYWLINISYVLIAFLNIAISVSRSIAHSYKFVAVKCFLFCCISFSNRSIFFNYIISQSFSINCYVINVYITFLTFWVNFRSLNWFVYIGYIQVTINYITISICRIICYFRKYISFKCFLFCCVVLSYRSIFLYSSVIFKNSSIFSYISYIDISLFLYRIIYLLVYVCYVLVAFLNFSICWG